MDLGKDLLGGLFLLALFSVVVIDYSPASFFSDAPALQALKIRPVHVFLGNKIPFALITAFQ